MMFELQDRLIAYDKVSSIKLGIGSYIVGFDYAHANDFRYNVLVGRYCSISAGIKFISGMNHVHKRVTTYPFDVFLVLTNSLKICFQTNHLI